MSPALTGLVLTALLTGALAATLARLLVPPTPRLADRVRPYTVAARTALGRPADVGAVARPGLTRGGVLRRLLGPPVERLLAALTRIVDTSADGELLVALQHAGMLEDVPEGRRVQEFRFRRLAGGLAGGAGGLGAGLALRLPAAAVVLLALAGAAAGASRPKARLDRAVEQRRARMRIELYTVNHLLAMHVRVGGGVAQALRRICERGNGLLVDELSDILHTHEAGTPLSEALARAARTAADPAVARTYRLLATGAELGADLGEALLAHSEDVREARREALRRTAVRRRAAMLVPTVGILAPVMLLFVAAPLPSLVFGIR